MLKNGNAAVHSGFKRWCIMFGRNFLRIFEYDTKNDIF